MNILFNNFSIIDKEIDYQKVNEIIEKERKKSMDYLKNAIK